MVRNITNEIRSLSTRTLDLLKKAREEFREHWNKRCGFPYKYCWSCMRGFPQTFVTPEPLQTGPKTFRISSAVARFLKNSPTDPRTVELRSRQARVRAIKELPDCF